MTIAHEQNQRSRLKRIISGQMAANKSAVLIPLIHEEDGWKTLFIQRGPGQAFAGQFSFMGGKVEKGESEIQAAIREAMEEANLDPTHASVLKTLGHSVIQIHNPRTHSIVDTRESEVSPPINLMNNYSIRPVVANYPREVLRELRPDGKETTRVVKVPLKAVIEAIHGHHTHAATFATTEDTVIGEHTPTIKVQTHHFTLNGTDVQTGQNVPFELHHLTAGMLHEFLSPFKNEQELTAHIFNQPHHQENDALGSWQQRQKEAHLQRQTTIPLP
jgi:8-oxo-dGTP pyrophosphatase MutT (NUDIX family)